MKSKFKKLQNSEIELKASINQEEFQYHLAIANDQAIASINLKGFRKGCAPKELAEQYINKETVFEAATEAAIKDSLDKIVSENDWTLIDSPKIEIDKVGDGGLSYKASLIVFPEIKIGNYKKIGKRIFAKKVNIDVNDEEIDKVLVRLQDSRAKQKLADKTAGLNDLIEAEFKAYLDPAKLINESKHWKFYLKEDGFPPGFLENIINHKTGDELDFSLHIPDNFTNTDWRGKAVNFKMKILGVYEKELPILGDEFARSLGAFKDLDGLKTSIKEGLYQEKEMKAKKDKQLEFLETLAHKSKFSIPQIMLDKATEKIAADNKMDPSKLKEENNDNYKNLLEKAEEEIKRSLLIYEIAKRENLTPSESEIEEEMSRHPIDSRPSHSYIYDMLKSKKVFEYLESL